MDTYLDNKATPLLSIIMATYNAQKDIASSIASILNQDYYNFELLICNDASTDNTLSIIKEINDSRIKIFNNLVNVGVSEARNILLRKAKGEFISIFDSDDICCQKKFTYCINYLMQNPVIDLIGTKVLFINQNSKRINFIRTFESLNHDDIFADLLFNNTFATSTIIFKKKILPLVKFPVTLQIGEDYYLWSKLSQMVICENLDIKLTKYRINPNSLSHKKRDDLKVSLNLIHELSLIHI
jgi:glycosyltransferase involved in cell wall biosynthesis